VVQQNLVGLSLVTVPVAGFAEDAQEPAERVWATDAMLKVPTFVHIPLVTDCADEEHEPKPTSTAIAHDASATGVHAHDASQVRPSVNPVYAIRGDKGWYGYCEGQACPKSGAQTQRCLKPGSGLGMQRSPCEHVPASADEPVHALPA